MAASILKMKLRIFVVFLGILALSGLCSSNAGFNAGRESYANIRSLISSRMRRSVAEELENSEKEEESIKRPSNKILFKKETPKHVDSTEKKGEHQHVKNANKGHKPERSPTSSTEQNYINKVHQKSEQMIDMLASKLENIAKAEDMHKVKMGADIKKLIDSLGKHLHSKIEESFGKKSRFPSGGGFNFTVNVQVDKDERPRHNNRLQHNLRKATHVEDRNHPQDTAYTGLTSQRVPEERDDKTQDTVELVDESEQIKNPEETEEKFASSPIPVTQKELPTPRELVPQEQIQALSITTPGLKKKLQGVPPSSKITSTNVKEKSKKMPETNAVSEKENIILQESASPTPREIIVKRTKTKLSIKSETTPKPEKEKSNAAPVPKKPIVNNKQVEKSGININPKTTVTTLTTPKKPLVELKHTKEPETIKIPEEKISTSKDATLNYPKESFTRQAPKILSTLKASPESSITTKNKVETTLENKAISTTSKVVSDETKNSQYFTTEMSLKTTISPTVLLKPLNKNRFLVGVKDRTKQAKTGMATRERETSVLKDHLKKKIDALNVPKKIDGNILKSNLKHKINPSKLPKIGLLESSVLKNNLKKRIDSLNIPKKIETSILQQAQRKSANHKSPPFNHRYLTLSQAKMNKAKRVQEHRRTDLGAKLENSEEKIDVMETTTSIPSNVDDNLRKLEKDIFGETILSKKSRDEEEESLELVKKVEHEAKVAEQKVMKLTEKNPEAVRNLNEKIANITSKLHPTANSRTPPSPILLDEQALDEKRKENKRTLINMLDELKQLLEEINQNTI